MEKDPENLPNLSLEHHWSLQEDYKVSDELEGSLVSPPPTLKKAKSLTTKKLINLLTYNLFLRPPLITNNGNDFKNERLNLFKDYLYEFDIINFQEVFQTLNNRKKELVGHAKKEDLNGQLHVQDIHFFQNF